MRHQPALLQPWLRSFLLAALVLAPSLACADSISTQVTCSVPGQPGMVASSSCSQQGSNQSASQQSITTSVLLPGSLSDYFSIQLTETGRAAANIGSDSQSSSSATISLTLDTAGPQRAGYIEVVPSYSANTEYASSSNLSFSIGSLQGSCGGTLSVCSLSSPGVNYPNFPRMYEFTLGDPFTLDLDYFSVLDAQSEDYSANSYVNFTLQFSLFEADGVTPIAISPEPSTLFLACAGSIAAILIRNRRLAATPKQ